MHVSVAEAPNVVEYLPATQLMHAVAPVMILYFPAVHAAHDTPLSPVNPPLQRQLLERILPLGDSELFGQLMHVLDAEAPTVGEYLPAPQSIQELTPGAPGVVRYLPAPQSVHVAATNAPVVAEYLPAPQSVHPTEPISSLYFPASHAVHVAPLAPVYPALHWQLVETLLPVGEIEFGGQELHAAEPGNALYSPGRHSTQVSPSVPVAPALQVQSVRRADSGGEFEFSGQRLQVGLPSGDHPPAEHGWHVSTPVAPTAAE